MLGAVHEALFGEEVPSCDPRQGSKYREHPGQDRLLGRAHRCAGPPRWRVHGDDPQVAQARPGGLSGSLRPCAEAARRVGKSGPLCVRCIAQPAFCSMTSPSWSVTFCFISGPKPAKICEPTRTQAACTCTRPSEVWALWYPGQPPSWTDRAGSHTGAVPAAPRARDQRS